MGFILIKFKFQLPLVSLLHETKSCSTHPRASAQEDAQWQIRFDWADREPHDPLHDHTFHLTDIRHGLCNISLWLAGRNLNPEPLHKNHLQFLLFGLYRHRGLGNLSFTWNLKNKLFPNSPAMLVQQPRDRQGSGQLCHQPQKLHFRALPSLEQLELSPGWSLHTELSVSLQAHNSSIIV